MDRNSNQWSPQPGDLVEIHGLDNSTEIGQNNGLIARVVYTSSFASVTIEPLEPWQPPFRRSHNNDGTISMMLEYLRPWDPPSDEELSRAKVILYRVLHRLENLPPTPRGWA